MPRLRRNRASRSKSAKTPFSDFVNSGRLDVSKAFAKEIAEFKKKYGLRRLSRLTQLYRPQHSQHSHGALRRLYLKTRLTLQPPCPALDTVQLI